MPELDCTTTYRDIPGYPGYRAGTDGSIWSNRKSGPAGGSRKWRKLKPYPASPRAGHLVVTMRPMMKKELVHRLVLLTFSGPCPLGMECRHFPDRDPTNNHWPENIRWGTKEENQADRAVHGTSNRGEQCGASILTSEQVTEIRAVPRRGNGWQKALAEKYGVSQMAVSDILRGKTWKHLTSPAAEPSPARPPLHGSTPSPT